MTAHLTHSDSPGAPADRIAAAIALTPAERQAIVADFFTARPGRGSGPLGLGRAIRDFQAWEIASGRVAQAGGSAWWRAVNGMMALDIRSAMNEDPSSTPALDAWRLYAAAGGGTQALLWEAHHRSLHSAIAICGELLARETPAEQAFAAIVIDVVDRTALADMPTDTADLAAMTERFYPAHYPVDEAELPHLERMQVKTAERLMGPDGAPFTDAGLNSRRWS